MKREFNLNNLVRQSIKSLKPYASARDEYKGTSTDIIFLDANENPFDSKYNRYPDPQQDAVKRILSQQKGVSKANILLGNGSDEVLDLIFRAFCNPNIDNVITLPPTYGMYEVLANINAVDVVKIQLTENFQPNVEQILEAQNNNSKLLFLCSPNNPTANSLTSEKIEQLIKKFRGIVVIDEAYIDFSREESWLSRLEEFPNVIITQTLSKAYGMAGIRLGICYASEEIIRILNKIKPPYNINTLTQDKAIERLLDSNTIELDVKRIISDRVLLANELSKIDFIETIYPSDTNFLLVKVDNANKRYQQLLEYGIVVRNRTSQPLCDNCLRFTVGTFMENEELIMTLKTLT
ncbi:histidinol-phosphate transaminase [Pontimicrobium sp. IMCC45349]|uniref:histidinol-phosphate transaminase n=1 Tax=Pontimicrobium sp. IMCC45349 TaxID=3391574 RepID=UPI0039A1E99C